MWSVNKLGHRLTSQASTIKGIRRLNQTLVEKIVQKYASDLPSKDYKVRYFLNHLINLIHRALDYVSVEPHHLMTHDNTSAVMIKFFQFYDKGISITIRNLMSKALPLKFSIQSNLFSLLITTFKTLLQATSKNTKTLKTLPANKASISMVQEEVLAIKSCAKKVTPGLSL